MTDSERRHAAAVPINQLVAWYTSEIANADKRLQQAMSAGKMRPAVAEHIRKNMRAVLATLRQVERQQASL